MSYVISVGTGINQLPLIRGLARKGYGVVGFDRNPNSPGKELCDYFEAISTWDHAEAIEWLAASGLCFKGVGCFSFGKALMTQQRIAHYFDLPAQIAGDLIELTCDKLALRKFLTKLGLSTLNEWPVNQYKQTLEHQRGKGFIVKPKHGGSSTDVHRFSVQTVAQLSGEEYIVQEFLFGVEYRMVALISCSKIVFFGLLKKENLRETFITARLTIDTEDHWAKSLLKRLVSALGLTEAALKVDCIKNTNTGRIEILEIDFGIGGDYFETVICPYCYNYDYVNNYVSMILGERPVMNAVPYSKYDCFDYIYNLTNGQYVINNSLISQALKQCLGPDIIIVRTKQDGNVVGSPSSNMDNIVGVLHGQSQISNFSLNEMFAYYVYCS